MSDRSARARPERNVMTFAQIENDEKYLNGLWLDVSRTRTVIHRALAAVEESRALLDQLLTEVSPRRPPDRPEQSSD
jgi:hypothetical protein